MPKLRLKLIPTSYTEDTMDMPDGEDGLDTLGYHTVLTDILDTHMLLLTLLPSVKLKLMLIQHTSTTDMPVTPDTDSDTDIPDTHMLDSMELTHMLMDHLTQPTPISSTPPV